MLFRLAEKSLEIIGRSTYLFSLRKIYNAPRPHGPDERHDGVVVGRGEQTGEDADLEAEEEPP